MGEKSPKENCKEQCPIRGTLKKYSETKETLGFAENEKQHRKLGRINSKEGESKTWRLETKEKGMCELG